jgi:RNA recognition motif-containing protein
MTSSNNTLWMGNIEKWMSHLYISNLLQSINIYPKRITIKNYKSKRGCAFLEFSSQETAQKVLVEYNNKEINGIKLKFNWVHSLQEKNNKNKITKFTVSKNDIFIFLNSFLLVI